MKKFKKAIKWVFIIVNFLILDLIILWSGLLAGLYLSMYANQLDIFVPVLIFIFNVPLLLLMFWILNKYANIVLDYNPLKHEHVYLTVYRIFIILELTALMVIFIISNGEL